MFQELKPSEYEKVRSLFQGFDYSLSIQAAIEGNNPGRIFVNNLEAPRTALALTVEGTLLAGDHSDPTTITDLNQLFEKQIFTGQLGEVMQESIQAAMTVVRSRAASLGLTADFHEGKDIHIHVPEGATPKDGPSAGVGMCTSIVSALTGIPVHANVAMTGEITLRGEVLPIGGLKEKLLAAHRGGIDTVLIPHENEKDLVDIPKTVLDQLDIKPVRWIDQVLEVALQCMPTPIDGAEVTKKESSSQTKSKKGKGSDPLRPH